MSVFGEKWKRFTVHGMPKERRDFTRSEPGSRQPSVEWVILAGLTFLFLSRPSTVSRMDSKRKRCCFLKFDLL